MADQGPIPLSSIRTLLLTSHAQTAHRRSPPIPQLSCVDSDPSLCRLARSSITTMTCTSLGSDGPGASDGGREDEPSAAAADIQWSCQADLPEEIRLGATHVVCEGYDSPADTDVLRGSCGVRYTVGLTDLGEDRSRPPHLLCRRSGSGSGPAGGEEQAETRSSRAAPYLFWLIFSAVLVRILYGAQAVVAVESCHL
ncbi:Protein of unknown function (DUF1183) [Geosmithia morbida]|uniref:Store-operated calcium entry-associated regulatory factor n=1 Tax=Geosmithia morbida TaxID=1094350 RepID=A0A9P5D1R8_9HYPO|nr:Protein of unknown function (DUF1183) [Geosmithia morbida]KAF4124233.1 Protein of unknown function (DUF1183) [Geosmithia morbida]